MDALPQRICERQKPLRSLLKRSIPRNIREVELTPAPAFAKDHKSMTAQQREGKRFERSLVRWLEKRTTARVLSQTWVRYSDAKGSGWACPDIVIPDARIIIECKRTYTPEADAQLVLVYWPLVERLWPGGGWKLVAAAKNWAGDYRPLIASPLAASVGLNYYLHRS